MRDKKLYIIAGCNGAGKTTASFTILPEILDCREFVNADEIAKGLSPFQPEVIERRYTKGIKNLFDIYLPIVNGALIFDNSEGEHQLLADKQIDGKLNIVNQEKFNLIKNCYDNH